MRGYRVLHLLIIVLFVVSSSVSEIVLPSDAGRDQKAPRVETVPGSVQTLPLAYDQSIQTFVAAEGGRPPAADLRQCVLSLHSASPGHPVFRAVLVLVHLRHSGLVWWKLLYLGRAEVPREFLSTVKAFRFVFDNDRIVGVRTVGEALQVVESQTRAKDARQGTQEVIRFLVAEFRRWPELNPPGEVLVVARTEIERVRPEFFVQKFSAAPPIAAKLLQMESEDDLLVLKLEGRERQRVVVKLDARFRVLDVKSLEE